MNKKRITVILSYIVLFLFVSLIVDNSVKTNRVGVISKNAGSTWNASGTCSETISSNGQYPIATCVNSSCDPDNGMCSCVKDKYGVNGSIQYPDANNSSRYKRIILYDIGRIDAWGNNSASGGTTWITVSTVSNVQICPGMTNLSYNRTEDIPSEIMQHNVNGSLKIISGKKPDDFNNYTQQNSALSSWAVKDYTISAWGDTTTGQYVYKASIPKLSTSAGGPLGISGVTKTQSRTKDAAGTYYSNNSRGYHYYLPYQIEFEYDACKGSGSAEFAANNPGVCCDTYPDTCQAANPCTDGTSTQTSQEYANANPGACCYEYPETCCNTTTLSDGSPWIGTANDDGIWETYYKNSGSGDSRGWLANVCCTNQTFVANNPGKCNTGIISFPETQDKTCLRNQETDYIYTTSYIQLNSSNKIIGSNVTCSPTTGACDSTYTYNYTISVNATRKYLTSNIAHSYFNEFGTTHYNAYLAQRADGDDVTLNNGGGTEIQPPNSFRDNSLADNNFTYTVSNIRKDPNDNDKYLIDISVTIYNIAQYYENTPHAYDYAGTKVYFVPIRIGLCWNKHSGGGGGGGGDTGGNTCTNMTYAKNHLNECCNDSSDFGENNKFVCCTDSTYASNNPSICTSGGTNSFVLNNSLSCNGTDSSATTSYTSSSTETLLLSDRVKIDKEDFKIEASSPTVVSGTGFEYPLKITDKVTFSLNVTGGTLDNPLNSKSEMENKVTEFKNALNNISSNYVTNYVTNQEITLNDSNTYNKNRNLTYIIPNSVTSSTITYSGNITYYYKDSTADASCYRFNCVGGDCDYEWRGTETPINIDDCNKENFDSGNAIAIFSDTIYDTTAEQTYTYEAKLPYAYINKNDATEIEYENNDTNPNDDKYISGGNKLYTNIITPSGYYDFNISVKNGGITKKIGGVAGTNIYSCSYRVLNCAIEGVCPPTIEDDDCDPSVEICDSGECDPLTDPTCPPGTTPGTSNYYFRPISLTNPFPNERTAGSNWFKYLNGNSYTYITTNADGSVKGESVYTNEPMYEITITNQMASDIREFNKNYSDYSSNETMIIMNDGICRNGLCRQSEFLNHLTEIDVSSSDISAISIGDGLKIRNDLRNNRYCRIGDFGTLGGGC